MYTNDDLGPIWSNCFDLAIEGFAEGSLAISAVIATPKGEVVSCGRNQLYDTANSCNIVRNSHVAHAELNAIASIPEVHRNSRELILYTSVEPCPLCTGAIVMSRIRNVVVASRDGYAGSMGMLQEDDYLSSKHVQVSYEDAATEKVFYLLHLYSLWIRFDDTRRNDTAFFAKLGKYCPQYLSHIETLGHDRAFHQHVTSRDCDAVYSILKEI